MGQCAFGKGIGAFRHFVYNFCLTLAIRKVSSHSPNWRFFWQLRAYSECPGSHDFKNRVTRWMDRFPVVSGLKMV